MSFEITEPTTEPTTPPAEEPTASATPTPHVGTLADAFAMVQCTPSQAVQVLNTMAEANSDKDPTFAAAINSAILQIQGIPPTD